MSGLNRLATLFPAAVAVFATVLSGCVSPSLGAMRPLGKLESCADIVREMERANTFCARSDLRALVLDGTQRRDWNEVHAAWEAVTLRRRALEEAFGERSCAADRPAWICPKPCWGVVDPVDPCIVLCERRRRDAPDRQPRAP